MQTCGARIVTSSTGILDTSGTASSLGSNPNCSWIIMSDDPSKHITLTISYLLITNRPIVKNGDCEASNRVDIHEGMDESGPLIGRYCESFIPLPITTRGSAMFIHLVSPYNYYHGWFSATYSVLSSCKCNTHNSKYCG